MKAGARRLFLTWEYMEPQRGKWTKHTGVAYEVSRTGWDLMQSRIAENNRRDDRRDNVISVRLELSQEVTTLAEAEALVAADWAPAEPAQPPLLDYEYLVTVTARDRSVASAVVDLLEGDRGIEADYSVDVDYRGHRKAE